MLGNDYARQDCSLARALEAVGERWTLLILRDAFFGVRRFGDFQAHLDIPKAVLASRLDRLVAERLLERRPDPHHAGRPIYELTSAGRDLWPALHALLRWGDRHRGRNSRVFKHVACGTPIDERGSCPACGVMPAPEQLETEPLAHRRALRDDPVAVALRAPHRLLEPLDVQPRAS